MTYPIGPPSPDDLALADIDYATVTHHATTLTMTGEIDTAVVLAWLREYPTPPLVHLVDATDVSFISSAGLAYLITLMKAIAPAKLTVRAESRGVLRPMQQMGIDALLDITP